MITARQFWTLTAALLLASCGKNPGVGGVAGEASAVTRQANERFATELRLDEPQAFEDAMRGFIARPTGKLLAADGTVLQDFDAFKFVSGPAPETVNPSLWRHAQLNAETGLFKVTEGIYQLRGFDMGNMTLVEGKTGFIVVDTLTARESAAAALAFARQHLEPPRVLRRLQLLRRWSHEQITEVLPGSPRARRSHGAGAPSRVPIAVGSD